MATKQQYEAALVKAEQLGLGSLKEQDLKLVMTLYRESSSLGNRARRVVDGK
ncbi:hypothetical protein ABZ329_06585 [Streptomyces rubiginosohelvolus]|uniref:hypothetical protein n=1 Tax=Streptomyces TaxID=1883 RepID=UPI00136C87D4|nr:MULTISPECIES: hypothetical protein [unclassified Streptomyces]MZG04244.1 hypothetical protein [Streptomyces sp. SID5614]